jgi:hypothetical protein
LCGGFFKQRWKFDQEDIAEGHLSGFPRLRQFQQVSPSECFFLFASFSFFVQIPGNISRQDRL